MDEPPRDDLDAMNRAQSRFATGGVIPGQSSGAEIPVMLEPGYIIMATRATDADLERLENLGLTVDARRLREARDQRSSSSF